MLKPLDITITQFSLLSSISKLKSCPAGDLADHMGLERTTIIRSLNPLIEKGLVETAKQHEKNKRIFQLTEKGSDILGKARPLWHEAQKNIEERIGTDSLDALVDIVSNLTE
jgi:DNA-binding MarR family transcriptional regulator